MVPIQAGGGGYVPPILVSLLSTFSELFSANVPCITLTYLAVKLWSGMMNLKDRKLRLRDEAAFYSILETKNNKAHYTMFLYFIGRHILIHKNEEIQRTSEVI